jgi:hypothetical protein
MLHLINGTKIYYSLYKNNLNLILRFPNENPTIKIVEKKYFNINNGELILNEKTDKSKLTKICEQRVDKAYNKYYDELNNTSPTHC